MNKMAIGVDASFSKNALVKSTATSVHTSNALPVQRLIAVFTCRARSDNVAMSPPITTLCSPRHIQNVSFQLTGAVNNAREARNQHIQQGRHTSQQEDRGDGQLDRMRNDGNEAVLRHAPI